MSTLTSCSLLLALLVATGCASSKAAPVRTVPHVDLDRYMGDWRVIAHFPYWAEKGKVGTIDRYALNPDGTIANTFLYREKTLDAPEEQKRFKAWVHDKTTNAEWRVRFFGPIVAAYLVLDLDPEYRWAAVGTPSRKYFWVLARDTSLPDDVYQGILQRAAAQGFDIGKVKKVPQPKG